MIQYTSYHAEYLLSRAVRKNGHFVLSPKRRLTGEGLEYFHADTYLSKNDLLNSEMHLNLLAQMVVSRYLENLISSDICDFVVGSGSLGVVLATLVSRTFGTVGIGCRAVNAEKKDDGTHVIDAAYEGVLCNSKVLVVEDSLVSGTGASRTITALEKFKAHVQAVYCLASWPRVSHDTLGVPVFSLCELSQAQMWPEESCPMCQDPLQGPLTIDASVNSYGAQFFARHFPVRV